MRPPRSRIKRAAVRWFFKQSFAAFNRGDLDAAFGALPRQIEWDFVTQISEIDVGGTVRGADEIRRMLDRFLNDFAYRTNIEAYEDDGQRIVVRVHGSIRTLRTGLEMEWVFLQTWDYEDGWFIVRERMVESESGLSDLVARRKR